jgi:hypothetical protein
MAALLKRDRFRLNHCASLTFPWSMIFPENRFPLFGIMLYLPRKRESKAI